MKYTILYSFFSLVAMTTSGAFAADASAPSPVEAADRQFLANLEKGEEVQRPVPDTSEVKRSKPKAVATVKKTQEHAAQVKPEEPVKKTEVVEVRRAIPVTTVTTTVTRTSHGDRQDEDQDDHNDDNKFFHRLFHGERIFR